MEEKRSVAWRGNEGKIRAARTSRKQIIFFCDAINILVAFWIFYHYTHPTFSHEARGKTGFFSRLEGVFFIIDIRLLSSS